MSAGKGAGRTGHAAPSPDPSPPGGEGAREEGPAGTTCPAPPTPAGPPAALRIKPAGGAGAEHREPRPHRAWGVRPAPGAAAAGAAREPGGRFVPGRGARTCPGAAGGQRVAGPAWLAALGLAAADPGDLGPVSPSSPPPPPPPGSQGAGTGRVKAGAGRARDRPLRGRSQGGSGAGPQPGAGHRGPPAPAPEAPSRRPGPSIPPPPHSPRGAEGARRVRRCPERSRCWSPPQHQVRRAQPAPSARGSPRRAAGLAPGSPRSFSFVQIDRQSRAKLQPRSTATRVHPHTDGFWSRSACSLPLLLGNPARGAGGARPGTNETLVVTCKAEVRAEVTALGGGALRGSWAGAEEKYK
ncbi:collagen alpha-1(I) chain-like [Phalacrocorax carbo]|uniref:collagen alpha-1(I) chain-like n=1 Tax=Phalacrocorax carbo TaxID=9209 RepID=UPI00311987C1